MKLTEPQVRYVADLANLELTDAEITRMVKDLDEILSHIEKLNELDTSAVEPMAQVLYDSDETATLRADEAGPTLDNTTATANSALSGMGFFKVPKIIER